jgi:hypothetical protein
MWSLGRRRQEQQEQPDRDGDGESDDHPPHRMKPKKNSPWLKKDTGSFVQSIPSLRFRF